jgi:hypothetical protein
MCELSQVSLQMIKQVLRHQRDLARKESQRQADDPNVVGEHALDGEVGLAGVGRPKNGRHAASPLGIGRI